MILVETSVLVQFIRGETNEKVLIFEDIIKEDRPFGISVYTYAEVLQGARDKKGYEALEMYLGSQTLYYPLPGKETFKEAATIVYNMRKNGYQARGLVDVLIAVTAIHNGLVLLHNDKDFEFIKKVEKRLRTI